MNFQYVRLNFGDRLPEKCIPGSYKAIVAVEGAVEASWRDAVCAWLVETGCLYAMTWGVDCEIWHECIDETILERHGFGNIPDEARVMTTWHEDEPISEVMWFAKFAAAHEVSELSDLLLLHIASVDRRNKFESLFEGTAKED